MVYDVTDEDSVSNVQRWLHEIERYRHGHVNKMLAGNKCDYASYIQCRHALAGCIRLCKQNRATTYDSILLRLLAMQPDKLQQQIIQRAFTDCTHKKLVDYARAKAIQSSPVCIAAH